MSYITAYNNSTAVSLPNLARDSIMLSALYEPMLSPARQSVTRLNQSKTVEFRIKKFSPYDSSIPLVLRGKFHPSGAVKQKREAIF